MNVKDKKYVAKKEYSKDKKYFRTCHRCGNNYYTSAKHGEVCKKCRKPAGQQGERKKK